MAHVQNQIRQNALEVQDFLKELQDWQSEAKSADKNLKKANGSAKVVPPVRGRVEPSLDRAAATAAAVDARTKEARGKGKATATTSDNGVEGAPTQHAAGHTYDYFRDKWDKFNVEAALAEASSSSDEDQPNGGLSRAMRHANNNNNSNKNSAGASTSKHTQQDSTKPPPSSHARSTTETQSAESLKEEGNRLFKSGRWKEAVELYGRSIAVQPSSVAHANRAMALMKLNRHEEAIADCTASVSLDSNYTKGYWRRATAHRTLGNHYQAVLDYESALRLEPTSKELVQERRKAMEHFMKEAGLKPLAKPAVIDVREEVDGEDPLVMDEAAHSFPNSPQGLHEHIEAARAQPASTSYAKPAAISVVASAPEGRETTDLPSVAPPLRTRNKSSAPTSPTLDQVAANAARAAAEKARLAVAQAIKPPSSAYEFEVSWKALAGDAHVQANYLKMIPPQRLPAIFKDSLTAGLLTQMLDTLRLHFVQSDASIAADIVTALSHVARFDMLVMLLPAKDRAVVRALWDLVASDVNVPTEVKGRFDTLRIKFRVK